MSNKPEKLVSAIYLITGFFVDQEPLKWKLRSLASELVPLAVSLNGHMSRGKDGIILEIKNLISKTMGLLAVAKNAGLISAENQDLMHGELLKYVAIIDHPTGLAGLFDYDTSDKKIDIEAQKLELKDKSDYETQTKKLLPALSQQDKSLREFGAVSVKKNTRQSVIIGVLKRKKEIMIKDVSPLIGGCSEKTIQRELSSMVRAGILTKMGEKRWSRYSLA